LSIAPLTSPAELRERIEQELGAQFADRAAAAEAYGQEFSSLWQHAARHALGGKLVRPALMVEAYDALVASGTTRPADERPSRTTLVRLAASIELLHYSFLLHDDVIDGDLMRRGTPNLIGALLRDRDQTHPEDPDAALHWARTGGILMGDLLLSAAHQIFARAPLAPDTRLRMLDLLDHTITESVAGEQVDVGLSDGVVAPDLGTILAMTAHKTATYSFELPLRAAAILSGSPPAVESALTSAGRHLGLAFQLQDDLLSTFGDPAEHGKDAFSDLREGKQTVILAYARMTSTWPSIEPALTTGELDIAEAGRVARLLTDCGAEDFARSLIAEQLTALYELLAGAGTALPRDVRRVLLGFATRLDGRRV
jgi:geranylgeranyl diphosphate synthase type II